MKKFFAVLMALVLVLSMGVTAFAADETPSITINNAVDKVDYTIYKMFDFTPIEGDSTKGRYTVATGWGDFLTGDGAAYLELDPTAGTIKFKGEETDERKAELAKAAVAYAKANSVEGKKITASGTTVEFKGLDLGYYAVDTSLGALCALTTTKPTATIKEKNSAPTIDKLVQEDSEKDNEDKGWGDKNSASIGDTVNYKSTITVGKGAQKYIVHDKMEAGLTFTGNVVIMKGDEPLVAGANNDYVLTTSCQDGCTFEIDFTDDFEKDLVAGETIIITYSAVLNENAKIFTETNDNEIWLKYGETFETTHITTETTTFRFDLVKTNIENTIIDGAEFELYSNSEAGQNVLVKLVKVEEGKYRVAKADDTETTTTIKAGKVTIYGLDSDAATKYYLKETKAPDGYNAINGNIEVVLGTGEGANFNASNLDAETDGTKYTSGGVEVENKTGGLLPETGGIGTTIFYIVGITLMLGAAILLISKKKMAAKA